MLLIQEIKKALKTKYETTTLWTVDHIPFYLNYAPNVKNYPMIRVTQAGSGLTMAMPDPATKPEGWNYTDGRWQITVLGNVNQETTIESIANQIENLYHRQSLTLGNNCTHIATFSLDNHTSFFDEQQKIWGIHVQFRIIAGV
jgi:hypothetical protein